MTDQFKGGASPPKRAQRSYLHLLFAASVALLALACGTSEPTPSIAAQGDTATLSAISGLTFYVENGCASCHCNDAGGGCNLSAPGIRETNTDRLTQVLTQPGAVVSHPLKLDEPPAAEVLTDLTRFLNALERPQELLTGDSQIARGFNLYTQAGCVVCHLSSAQGTSQGGIGVPIAGTDPDNIYAALTGQGSSCHPLQLNPPEVIPEQCTFGIQTNDFVRQLTDSPPPDEDSERSFLAFFLTWIAPPPVGGTEPCENQPGEICTYAGLGFGAFTRDGVEASTASVYSPLEVDGSDWDDDGQLDLVFVDWNNHRIRIIYENRMLDDGTLGNRIESLAGTGKVTGDDALNHPTDIAFHPLDGALTMANWHNQNMYRYHKGVAGSDRDQLAGLCDLDCPDDSAGPTLIGETRLGLPYSLALHPDGERVYVSESACSRIRLMRIGSVPLQKVQPSQCITPVNLFTDSTIETIAGAAGQNMYAGDDTGLARDARFNINNTPVVANFGISLSPVDNRTLYVADFNNNVIRAIDVEADPPTIRLVAGDPNSAGYQDGPAATALFNHPSNLYAHPDGSVYVVDAQNHRIRKIDAQGMVTTIAGNGRGSFNGDNQPALEASLNSPGGVWVHPTDGRVFIADTNNHRVRVVCPAAGCPARPEAAAVIPAP